MFLLDVGRGPEFSYEDLLNVICRVLQAWPNERKSTFYECQYYIKECEWFRIYEFIEGIYKVLTDAEVRSLFTENINAALVEDDIGWQLVEGRVIARGDDVFESAVKTAVVVLEQNEKPTAASHIRSAITALSIRPKANTSGAVAHATNAIECVLGEVTGQTLTLGKYLDRYPDLFHPALKKGLDGIYGYASAEGARHGKEGTEPALEDAIFVVTTCAAVCTMLTRKHADGKR